MKSWEDVGKLVDVFEAAIRFAYTQNKYGFLKLESRLPAVIESKQKLLYAIEQKDRELGALKKEYDNLSRSAQDDFKYSKAMRVLSDPVTSSEIPFKVIKVHDDGFVDILEPSKIIEEIEKYE